MKDLIYSDKEIASQNQRIENVRADKEKDEADVKKQIEVLEEYQAGKKFEQGKLLDGYEDLKSKVLEAKENAVLMATEELVKAVAALKDAAPILIACDRLEEEDWQADLVLLPSSDTTPE